MKAVVIGALATLLTPAASAAWSGFDPRPEPNTRFDPPTHMFTNPPVGPVDRIHFDARLDWNVLAVAAADVSVAPGGSRIHPLVLAHAKAILGAWRDCNGDGYLGDAATGNLLYPAAQLPAASPCPEGSPYVHDGLVDELRSIGPGATSAPSAIPPVGPQVHVLLDPGFGDSVPARRVADLRDLDDPGARVWGDWKLPWETQIPKQGLLPLPGHHLESFHGHTEYVDDSLGGEASRLLAETLGPDAWEHRPDFAPSPLGEVKSRYNDSEDASERGTPLARPWRCDAPGEGPAGATPGIEPRLDVERGSVVGTFDELFDLDRSDPSSCGGGDAPGGSQLLHWERDVFYANLEDHRGDADHARGKVAHDFAFRYHPETRFTLSAGPEAGDATGDCGPSLAFHCPLGGGIWIGEEVWSMRGARAGSGTLHRIHLTFYAKVTVEDAGDTPSGLDAFVYGSEACNPGIDADALGWTCDPEEWEHNAEGIPHVVLVGETYALRDVDCFDNELGSSGVHLRDPRDASLGAREENVPCD